MYNGPAAPYLGNIIVLSLRDDDDDDSDFCCSFCTANLATNAFFELIGITLQLGTRSLTYCTTLLIISLPA